MKHFSRSYLCLNQQGTGLVEVLITLLLFTLSSLALTQLQLKNLQTVHESYQWSQQALLRGEVLERLWQERCYLVHMSDQEVADYLRQRYPFVLNALADDPYATIQSWRLPQTGTGHC